MIDGPDLKKLEQADSGEPVYWDGKAWWVFWSQGLPKESGILQGEPQHFDTEEEAVAFVVGMCMAMEAADLCAEVITPARWLALPEDTECTEDDDAD